MQSYCPFNSPKFEGTQTISSFLTPLSGEATVPQTVVTKVSGSITKDVIETKKEEEENKEVLALYKDSISADEKTLTRTVMTNEAVFVKNNCNLPHRATAPRVGSCSKLLII